ncbi:cutinase family protein [Nocardia farcinica]|uniref:cutinase family protein n=1 Tax=Nocardia TaxID=1817 RepID=UPI00031A6CB7|nr:MULTISPECIES: cutinase family protein [Nocardia]MBF6588471.1 cutinase family protein [Nocardia farcinica]
MRAFATRAVAVSGISAAVAAMLTVTAPTAAAEDTATGTCPDIHVLAVQGTGQSRVDAPTDDDSGELSAVVLPVLNAAQAEGFTVERTYIPYPADFGYQGLETAYKSSVMDGYNRLAQVAARVLYQCSSTKLVLLGYSQGGHVVSMFAQQIGQGKAGPVTAADIALVATFGDPTRGPDAPLFPGRPGQVGPDPWPGTDKKAQPSAKRFPDMLAIAKGQGIGPARDIASSFGTLDGRVAQWCLPGDLACSAPKSISLARTGLAIAGQSSLDFSRDPFGVVGSLAAATANTIGGGLASFAENDVKGKNLADAYFDGSASISQRLEAAADPRNENQANPLVGVLKMGQMVMSSMTTFLGQVFNSATLGSLINAGVQVATSAATGAIGAGAPALVGGPAAAAAAASAGAAAGAASAGGALTAPVVNLASNAAKAAINIIPPQSAEKKVSSIFDLLINEVKANADLPALLLDARLWNQQATHGGYRTARVAADGGTPVEITADWVIAAGRDLHAAAAAEQAKKNPATSSAASTSSAKPTSNPITVRYDRDKDGNVTNPLGAPVADDGRDTSAVAHSETPGDVRLTSSAAPIGTGADQTAAPAVTTPVAWLPEAGGDSIAAKVADAADEPTAPGRLLRIGSPVLAATPATLKEGKQ